VITSWRWRPAESWARLILQGNCIGEIFFFLDKRRQLGINVREDGRESEMLTEIKEEQLRGVLGTVVPARNEKIGTYL